MIRKVFTSELALPFIGGLFLCGILAAIMSTADSQLLVTASAVSEDLYHSFVKKDADTEEILKVSRITVILSLHGIRTAVLWDWFPMHGQDLVLHLDRSW